MTVCPKCGKHTLFSFNEDLGRQAHALAKHHPSEQGARLIYPCCSFKRQLDSNDLEIIRTVWPEAS